MAVSLPCTNYWPLLQYLGDRGATPVPCIWWFTPQRVTGPSFRPVPLKKLPDC